jgi:hypothetical protein
MKAQASSSNLCSEIRHKSILTYGSRLMFRLSTSTKGTLIHTAVTLVEVGEQTVFSDFFMLLLLYGSWYIINNKT